MVRCAATKRKGSTTQCTSNALKGLTMCGIHARAKTVTLWKEAARQDEGVVICQSLARRWLVLHQLRLAGPGVLSRKSVTNDEELVSCVEASKQYPLDYFAFEENGKVWWFDFSSIWSWSVKSVQPTNPYTRAPLTREVLTRLRECWALRSNRRLAIPAEPVPGDQRILHRWTIMCQVFHCNGFTDVSLDQLIRLGKISHSVVWRFLHDDCPLALNSSKYMLSPQLLGSNSPTYIVNSLRMLLLLVSAQKEPYSTVFAVMSAIYRC
jgi:hypothetical protein